MSSAAKGVMEVMVDGKTIFSNVLAHRMPAPGEILTLIRTLQRTAN